MEETKKSSQLAKSFKELIHLRFVFEEVFRNEKDADGGGLITLYKTEPKNKTIVSQIQPHYIECLKTLWEVWEEINKVVYNSESDSFDTFEEYVEFLDNSEKDRYYRYTVAEMISPDFEQKFWDAWKTSDIYETHYDKLIRNLMCATFHHTEIETRKPIVDEFIKEHPEILRVYDKEHLYKI